VDRFSVLIVDPEQLFRAGLRLVLAESAYDIAGEAGTAREARELLGRGAIDLLLFDIGSDWEDTAELVREAGARRIRAVVLTADRSRAAVEKAAGWGVAAYLLKEISPQALSRSLQLVMLGQQIFPGNLMVSAAKPKPAEPVPVWAPESLSRRELQILRYLVAGRSNKEIARFLDISEATVKVHLKGLLRKLRATNRTQAAIWARSNGIGEAPAAAADPDGASA
jgi:two-component system, NarL family, nitrate/nitrite response regulator NarL